MRRWRLILVLAACALAAGLVACWALRPKEPEFKGKSLTFLLRHPDENTPEAIRAIGTNALPFLVKWVDYKGPPKWQTWGLRILMKLPASIRNRPIWDSVLLSDADRHATESLAAFEMLGTAAAPASPQLTVLLRQSKSRNTRIGAAYALASIGEAGLPALLQVIEDRANPDAVLMVAALRPMHGYTSRSAAAIPALIRLAGSTNTALAMEASFTLAELHLDETNVVPVLAANLQNTTTKCVRLRAG